jgi:putative flippase GtrA
MSDVGRGSVPGIASGLRSLRTALGTIHPALASEAFWQLVRFAVGGLSVTLFAVIIYSAAATLLHVPPLAANGLSWLCAVVASYTIHSRWSFAADRHSGEGAMIARFLTVSVFAFGLNSFWVWLTTTAMGLPPLAPVPAMIFVTPFVSFLLNRFWVFKVA